MVAKIFITIMPPGKSSYRVHSTAGKMFTGQATEWYVAHEPFLACANIGVHAAERACAHEAGWREGNAASGAFSRTGEITGSSALFFFFFACVFFIFLQYTYIFLT